MDLIRFTYQSNGISFVDFISLLTLCFAPLIAHVMAGVPEPTVLCAKPPSWTERLVHYNPTSILWRYISITDRRIRAIAWDEIDMAACNALFWTPIGWDGSDEMAARSRHRCIQPPDTARVRLMSGESVKTIIILLQGIQALYQLVYQVIVYSTCSWIIALGNIFSPLAIMGLARLFPALWLSQDFSYARYESEYILRRRERDAGHMMSFASWMSMESLPHRLLRSPSSIEALALERRFRPTNYFWSRIFRRAVLLPQLGFFTICVLYLKPTTGYHSSLSLTAILYHTFYLFFLGVSICIYSFYLIVGAPATTVLPCVSRTWYKAYTIFGVVAAVILVIVAALGTRRTPCGVYTSVSSLFDIVVCPDDLQTNSHEI
jgi:hypothetical protein